MITLEEFQKIEIKIGKIIEAERIAGAKKLLKLTVDVGEEITIVAGIAESYDPDELVGREVPIVANLEPAKIKGIESEGMILAIDNDDSIVLLEPEEEVEPGATVG